MAGGSGSACMRCCCYNRAMLGHDSKALYPVLFRSGSLLPTDFTTHSGAVTTRKNPKARGSVLHSSSTQQSQSFVYNSSCYLVTRSNNPASRQAAVTRTSLFTRSSQPARSAVHSS